MNILRISINVKKKILVKNIGGKVTKVVHSVGTQT